MSRAGLSPERQAMRPESEKAMAVLGTDLGGRVFMAKPPISVLHAVRDDPAFK